MSALPLLPPDAQQVAWINNHAVDLYAQAAEAEALRNDKDNALRNSAKRFGPLAPVLVLLAKAKSLLFLLKFKFLFSLFAFVSFYWALYGKWFGIGFAVLVLCHEMGHYIEVKRKHLPVELPVFLPGFGAYVKWKNLGIPADGRAMIALAGPLAGFLSSAVCLGMYWYTHIELWAALARAGAWLNLLNLIPVWALDGGHAIEAISRYGRIFLALAAVALWWQAREWLFLAVAVGALWQVFFVRETEEGSLKIAAYFCFIMCALAFILAMLPGREFGIR